MIAGGGGMSSDLDFYIYLEKYFKIFMKLYCRKELNLVESPIM